MKKILFYTAFTAIIFASCGKKLDVLPLANIAESEVFTNDANIKKALNGAYDAVSSASAYGGDIQLYSELLASESANGELNWDGTYNQPREIFNKSMLTNNSYITATWAAAYRAINICNGIIANIDKVDDADRDRVQGEALFLRGSMYFELVKLFSKPFSAGGGNLGVPLILEPTVGNVSEVNYSPRSTVQESYVQIITDLTTAKQLLPEENDFYATTFAAAAQLSRVYLQTAEYGKARDEADYVISNSDLELTSTYAAAFNNQENTSEDIFAIQVSSQDGSNEMFLFWSITSEGARNGDVDVLQKHMDLYPAGDARYNLFYKDGAVWRSGKWRTQYRNLPVIRLAEMYLTRAEGNARLGTEVGATPFDDVKKIRDRAGVLTLPANATSASIVLERKLELAHEGQGIHDMKRLQQPVGNIAYDANRLVLPIPIREINAVGPSILQQNEGY
ncbi:MAG: RagB/SusD family nutrient uptake outer membrane protein [Chitinophagaceae bacterium]|nr:MAG: RagB/SusD family nutrient uptake outer membrane protein [Chitinophagaceae bacterium]